MHKPKKEAVINFHRIYSAASVDRVVLWNASKQHVWFPTLTKLPTPNKFDQEVVIYNGEVAPTDANSCQLLALGGEHTTSYRLGDLMSQVSDIEVVRGLRELQPGLEEYKLRDCIVLNTPKVFRYCIAEPDPQLEKLGWKTPILLDYAEKPKTEQPSELMERGFDPSDECIHFVGWVNWRLSSHMIDHWEEFLDVQVKVCLYTSHLLEDMKIVSDKPVPDKRSNWVKK